MQCAQMQQCTYFGADRQKRRGGGTLTSCHLLILSVRTELSGLAAAIEMDVRVFARLIAVAGFGGIAKGNRTMKYYSFLDVWPIGYFPFRLPDRVSGLLGPAARFAVPGAVLAGLAVLTALPPPVSAQTCTSTPSVTFATPLSLKADYTARVRCAGLTGGLTLTLEADAKIGTKEGPVKGNANNGGLSLIAKGAGTNDVDVTLNGQIYSTFFGVFAERKGQGDITVTTGADSIIETNARGIFVDFQNAVGDWDEGDIVINHNGKIKAVGDGLDLFARGNGGVMVTTGADSVIETEAIGISSDNSPEMQLLVPGSPTLTPFKRSRPLGSTVITHNGKIDASTGIKLVDGLLDGEDGGGITVTTGAASMIDASGTGIDVVAETASTGKVMITHNGSIDAYGNAISVVNKGTGAVTVTTGADSVIETDTTGIAADIQNSSSTSEIMITHSGKIHADDDGMTLFSQGSGSIKVTVSENSEVVSMKNGILVRHEGAGKFEVTIWGKVMGGLTDSDGSEYAGLRIAVKEGDTSNGGGGTVVVGPKAHLGAQSGSGIKISEYAGSVTLILEKDEDGYVGRIDGRIPAAVTVKTRTGSTGPAAELSVGDTVVMRGERKAIYTERRSSTLTAAADSGSEFTASGVSRIYDNRARLYEVLPSVLSGLNAQTPYRARMAVPRSGQGVWARADAGSGKRAAADSSTGRGFHGMALSWDVKQLGFEAGFDFPSDQNLRLGVSAYHRKSEAKVKNGGSVKASGTGVSLSATHGGDGGFFLDGRLSYTGFSGIELTSDTEGMIRSGVSGSGFAAGFEAGKPMELQGVRVTPRGGFTYSSVKTDAFDDLEGVPGRGKVELGNAESMKVRLGALAETGGGGEDRDLRVYGSLDLEHELAPEREVTASGTKLMAEVKPTWVRLGAGGMLKLADDTALSGEAYYATAGGGNSDFGGSIGLNFRF